jgi:hypothetical protein
MLHSLLPSPPSINQVDSFLFPSLFPYSILSFLPPFIHSLFSSFFFFLYIFMGFCVYVPLPPLRGQHTALCHPRWLPTSGLTEFAVCWGGAGFILFRFFVVFIVSSVLSAPSTPYSLLHSSMKSFSHSFLPSFQACSLLT